MSTGYAGKLYIDMLFEVVQRSINDKNTREVKAAASIITCLIECSPGLIDTYIPRFLQLMFNVLKNTKSRSTSIKLLEIFMAIIHYNVNLSLSIFNAFPDAANELFTCLFARLVEMEDTSTQRLIVASFCG